MSTNHDDLRAARRAAEVPADLRRALEHVERPAARPAFRADLKERFLAGAVDAGAATTTPQATVANAPPTRRSVAPPPRRHLVLLAGALVAAAAVVLTLFLTKVRAPLWRIHGSSTATEVIVDGIAMDRTDEARLVKAIGSARELEVHGGTLRLCVRDEAWLELADGTRLSKMRFAATGAYELHTDTGSLGVATLPAFAGRGMRIHTMDMALSVTGTVFAVDVDAESTCLCTLEGSVMCDPAGGNGPVPVPAGRMCFAFRDRRPPEWQPAYEPHLRPLRPLRDLRE